MSSALKKEPLKNTGRKKGQFEWRIPWWGWWLWHSVKIGQIKTLAYLKVSTSLLSNGMGTQFLFLYNSWKLPEPQNISGIFSHKIVLIWIITVRSFSIIWVIKRFSCLDNSTLLCTNLPITFLPEASSKTFWQNHTRSFIHDFKDFHWKSTICHFTISRCYCLEGRTISISTQFVTFFLGLRIFHSRQFIVSLKNFNFLFYLINQLFLLYILDSTDQVFWTTFYFEVWKINFRT